jgi:hypothetical protein
VKASELPEARVHNDRRPHPPGVAGEGLLLATFALVMLVLLGGLVYRVVTLDYAWFGLEAPSDE